jgi:membrane-associated phospholipid phosphatase
MAGPELKDGTPAHYAAAGSRQDARIRLLRLPQPPHWILTGMLLAAAVLALGMTAQLAPDLRVNELGIDQNLSRHHAAFLTTVARALNFLFGPGCGVAVIFLIALFLLLVRRAPVNAVAFGLVSFSGWVASEFFKIIIARQRPDQTLLFDPLAPESGSDSFPSGHVSFAVTLAFALYFLARGTRWSRAAAAAGALAAVVVAWSRLYIGAHYLSDVTASFLAAGSAVILLSGLWNRYAPRILDRLPVRAATRPFLS